MPGISGVFRRTSLIGRVLQRIACIESR